jgi:23S rRNA pseudouridine1911/1915/1917 synthase
MGRESRTRLNPAGKTPLFSRIRLVFEDEDLIVVDKPAGLLTIATDKERRKTVYALLYQYLKNKKSSEKIFIVHRLDREASGLLVFAKTESAKLNLQDQFKNRTASRKYVAVVEGRVRRDTDTIQSFLAENSIHRAYSTKDQRKGKLAITHIRVLKRSSQATLLEARLESGRKHQIRAHLSEQGHPILGDKTYGSQFNPFRRLALHAVSLSFGHPRTGSKLEFRSPCPPSFQGLAKLFPKARAIRE